MIQASIRRNPEGENATIEISGDIPEGAVFQLRDKESGKYLSRRGWNKNATALPAIIERTEDRVTLTIAADLVARIASDTALVLSETNSAQEFEFTWPARPEGEATQNESEEANADDEAASETGQPETEPSKADASHAAADDTADQTPAASDETAAKTEADRSSASAGDKKSDSAIDAAVDSLEPSIFGDLLESSDKAEAKSDAPDPAALDAFPEQPASTKRFSWPALAIAASLFFVIGAGIAYFGLAGRIEQAVQTASRAWQQERQSLISKLDEKEKQAAGLIEPKATSDTTSDESGALATVTAERDAALKQVEDLKAQAATLEASLLEQKAAMEKMASGESSDAAQTIAALEKQIRQSEEALGTRQSELEKAKADLASAQSELAALRKSNDEAAAAEDAEQAEAIKAANSERDTANAKLAETEQQLRDQTAKLSVAQAQIQTLETLAAKSTGADLEKTALAEKLEQLNQTIEANKTELEQRQKALAEAQDMLAEAREQVDTATRRYQELADSRAEAASAPAANNGASDEKLNQLQKERDLYAKELEAVTAKLASVISEKKIAEQKLASAAPGNASSQSDGIQSKRPLWGATAIDANGTIYAVQNQISEKVARENAVAICEGKSNSSCEPLSTFADACFSLARFKGEGPANDNFGYVVHKNAKTSAAGALAKCRGQGLECDLRFTTCSPDTLGDVAAQ
ncbi:DUF4189 domain-containing protein [Rhizobium alvei]|uniref:DUF4189 domain-containing protein n=1 Tax=Rhizobium alvei TaxID=1132659 RepID=A0ABT8YKG1_9HYPH|nr:DUF4189 domain-containing protein [Rhizobium alvei]MDO6964213.1 DUF4189 domain-containing protein [Rhizobium alvei]